MYTDIPHYVIIFTTRLWKRKSNAMSLNKIINLKILYFAKCNLSFIIFYKTNL